MSKKKKLLFSILATFVCLIFIETCSFLVLHFIGEPNGLITFVKDLAPPNHKHPRPKNNYHPLRDHAAITNQTFAKNFQTNGFGYIQTPNELANPDLIITILGSSSARTPVPATSPKQTLAARLQEKIRANLGLNVNVRNLALGSYYSFNELMTLYEYFEVHNLTSDIVISANGLYTGYTLKHPKFVKHPYSLFDEDKQRAVWELEEGKWAAVGRAISSVLQHKETNVTRLFHSIFSTIKINDSRVNKQGTKSDYWDVGQSVNYDLVERVAKREATNYLLMKNLSNANGAEFVGYLMPAMFTWENTPISWQTRKSKVRNAWIEAFYQSILDHSADVNIVKLSDAFDSLQPSRKPFIDKNEQLHYTPNGTNHLAEIIFENLRSNLLDIAKQKSL